MIEITGSAQYDAWHARTLPPVEQLAANVWVVPVPCPYSIRHTFSYVLSNDAGEFLVVDPGWDEDTGRHQLTSAIEKAGLRLSRLVGVVVTHAHSDHLAMAPWLASASGAWVGTHRVEAASIRRLMTSDRTTRAQADRLWLEDGGTPAQVTAELLRAEPWVPRALETSLRELEHDELLPLEGRDVRVLFTPGHTAGHLSVVDADNRVILTGDHVLPTISSNVGVGPHEPDRNSVAEYLGSLATVEPWADFEVLPAHQYRFRGLADRTAELRAHQAERSAEIRELLGDQPHATVWQIAERITWSRGWENLDSPNRRMALMEVTAHLRHLRMRSLA
ncbi:MBL fold metallo-hydrolase [Georgenia sp. SYP-B2076]|uniref:MBL fold metallo-hydrolase n=1 Tax=Georgenia sp. SYP-B2076 TaxID=2495881 RepID=UPI000F8F0FD8|nr:MBL fold metallo-hydrolase [Georgenia sp. SYP-B2076]